VKRLPEPWLGEFKKLADSEFASDYGMTIIFLYRYYIDDIKYKTLLDAMDELKQEVVALSGKEVVDNRPKTLDGKRLGGEKKDEKQ
jgi:hypothetical protein